MFRPSKMSQAFMTERIFIVSKRLDHLDISINLLRQVPQILFMKFIHHRMVLDIRSN